MLRTPIWTLACLALAAPAARGQLVEDWRARHDLEPDAIDVGQVCALGPSGELYVAGTTLVPFAQWQDTQVVRLDSSGALVWRQVYSGDLADDSATALAVDPAAGIVYVALHRIIDHPSNDVTLLAYGLDGTLLWSTVYDGPAHDRDFVGGRRIAVDAAQHRVYVPMSSTGVGSGPLGTSGFDAVLACYASTGALVWEQRFDGAAHVNDLASDVAIDGTRVLVCGTSDQGGATTSKLLVRAFTLDGTPLWTHESTIGGATTAGERIELDPAGDAYVSGRVVDTWFTADGRVWAFDALGAQRWTRSLGSSGVISAVELALDGYGGVDIATTQQDETNGVLVASWDTAGNARWISTWDPPTQEDFLSAFAVDAQGQLTLAVANGVPDRFTLLAYGRDGALTATNTITGELGGWIADAVSIAPSTTIFCGAEAVNGAPSEALFVMRVHAPWSAFCLGDGSEGACPCGNSSPTGERRGCANSHGPGARLEGSGLPSLAQDDARVTASELPATAPCILLQGDVRVSGTPFGDGVRCIGGSLRRLYVRAASAGTVVLPGAGDPSLSQRAQAIGDPLQAGSTRSYQLYYRNPAPSFCPPETYNVTNAVEAEWGL